MQVQEPSVHQPQLESHKQRPGQNVFKVQRKLLNHPLKASGIPVTSPSSVASRGFHPRKTHRKSRTGCRNCKVVRRIKCDENREGGCMKCQNHGLECDYLRFQPGTRKKHFEIREGLTSSCEIEAKSMAVESTGSSSTCYPTGQLSPLSRSLSFQPVLPVSFQGGEDAMAALYHFNTLTSYTCGSPQGQRIIHSYTIAKAMQTPYLLHALLGVTASHLTHLLPADVNAVQNAKHKLAAAYHWGHALRLFRKELSNKGAQEDNMDDLLSTIMLVAIYQFVSRDKAEDLRSDAHLACDKSWMTSFVFIELESERAEALNWLTIQAGFKVLLNQLGRYLPKSVWIPVLQDAAICDDREEDHRGKTWEQSYPDQDPDVTERLLCDLCGVDANSNETNNPYYGSLEIVLHVRRMRPLAAKHFNKMITFMGKVTPTFRQLLMDRDSAALLILAHWLSLILDLRQWWLTKRAEQECRAITIFLEARAREQGDERMHMLLLEPARTVGIFIDLSDIS